MIEARSEVACLLARIEAEYQAAEQGLSGFALTARHAFLTRRMERIGTLHQALQQIVGPQEALALLATPSQSREGA